MKVFELSGSLRTETGKKISKKLRNEKAVPAILYGGKENILLSFLEADLRHLIYTPDVFLINLTVGKKKHKAIIKEMQFHPVSDRVLHFDLLEISDDKKLTIALPVKLTGVSEGSKQGGKLSLTNRKLRVSGFIKDLPEYIEIDITNLGLGKSLQVDELSFDKFDIIEPKSTVIATVKLTRAARGAQASSTEAEA